jgi:hypothetical protein
LGEGWNKFPTVQIGLLFSIPSLLYEWVVITTSLSVNGEYCKFTILITEGNKRKKEINIKTQIKIFLFSSKIKSLNSINKKTKRRIK